MDRNTKKIYLRGAVFVVPVLLFAGCRILPRACIALADRDARRMGPAYTAPVTGEDLEADRVRRDREAANAAAMARAREKKPAQGIPAADGFKTAPIASAQQMPDAVVMDGDNVAWLSTHAGEVVIAPRAGGAPRVVAKDQKLSQRRHNQALALGGGWVYWLTAPKEEGEGAVMRAPIAGGAPETVAEHLEGLTAIVAEKENVWFARSPRVTRDDEGDGGVLGGVWLLKKDGPVRVVAAEMPCALAVDEKNVYVVDASQIWRGPKLPGKKVVAPTKLTTASQRLGCSVAVDKEHVYWTIPGDDAVMRAKKTDGTQPRALGFIRSRPTNVAVDGGYAWVLTETRPKALGEQGGVFRIALRADLGSGAAVPQAVIVDQVGLNSIATQGGHAIFTSYDQSENDGKVTRVAAD